MNILSEPDWGEGTEEDEADRTIGAAVVVGLHGAEVMWAAGKTMLLAVRGLSPALRA
jgi:hypothetical protein